MSNKKAISVKIEGDVAFMRFDRAHKRNAVNDRMIDEIGEWFSAVPTGVKAVVMSGRGDHFSAGLDLAEHAQRNAEQAMRHSQHWHRVLDLMRTGCGLPVIAAMHGGVIGGGLEIAVAAHVRVSDETTFFQLPEGRRGIFVGGGAAVRVSRIIGADRMVEMMLTGRRYSAQEGQSLGLSHYLVSRSGAEAKAAELAHQIVGNAPLSNYMILNAISRISDMAASDGFFTESMAAAISVTSEDAKKGLEAFLSKKDIRF